MGVDDFLSLVAAAQEQHPLWFDLPGDVPADDTTLDHIEAELGASLPRGYRWFLKRFGGGDFAFVSIYSADPDSDLLVTANQPAHGHAFVAISDDGTGNHFGFTVRDGVCEDKVAVLDHDEQDVRPTQFGEFLDFVAAVGLRNAQT